MPAARNGRKAAAASRADERIQLASSVVARLQREASELDWAGDHDAAERKRRQAQRIVDRGDEYEVSF